MLKSSGLGHLFSHPNLIWVDPVLQVVKVRQKRITLNRVFDVLKKRPKQQFIPDIIEAYAKYDPYHDVLIPAQKLNCGFLPSQKAVLFLFNHFLHPRMISASLLSASYSTGQSSLF